MPDPEIHEVTLSRFNQLGIVTVYPPLPTELAAKTRSILKENWPTEIIAVSYFPTRFMARFGEEFGETQMRDLGLDMVSAIQSLGLAARLASGAVSVVDSLEYQPNA
ncbi:MAG TPA: hypothetical protein VG604_04900 [Candidatus Saccharimonadales bacterium]|nr:hypothetical protein [Candidatus Saccharimonadales bacterium]